MIDSDNQSSGLKEVNREYLEIEKETDGFKNKSPKNIVSLPLALEKAEESITLDKSGIKQVKTILTGEHLTAVLNVFDPEFVISDGVDQFLVLVLAEIQSFKETLRQHVTGGKLREITEEVKSFVVGNKTLTGLFVHTPVGELQYQIRTWLAENFEFLSVTGDDIVGNILAVDGREDLVQVAKLPLKKQIEKTGII